MTTSFLSDSLQIFTYVTVYAKTSLVRTKIELINFLSPAYTQTIKIKCYQMYIRTICEYATVIWSPHLQTNIHQIEMIQRKAARLIFNDYSRHSSVTAMLTALDWKKEEMTQL